MPNSIFVLLGPHFPQKKIMSAPAAPAGAAPAGRGGFGRGFGGRGRGGRRGRKDEGEEKCVPATKLGRLVQMVRSFNPFVFSFSRI